MNNIITNFEQIIQQARQKGLPPKNRAILREFLQAKLITQLYAQPESQQLSFVGGTALRLLRNLPRFSEDLDFDNLGLTHQAIKNLITKLVNQLSLENIKVELHCNQKGYKNYFELRFPDLLLPLQVSSDPREKLLIKVDYTQNWHGHKTESILFNDYGFIERVVTNHIDQILVQKLAAYVQRKQTQPRDIFDIVWLYGKGARLDQQFMKLNNLEKILVRAQKKFEKEGLTQKMKQKLEPFLLHTNEVSKLELFDEVLEQLISNNS